MNQNSNRNDRTGLVTRAVSFIKQTYAKVAPLSKVDGSCLTLYAFPRKDATVWHIEFYDGFTGRRFKYEWTGRGMDDANIKPV